MIYIPFPFKRCSKCWRYLTTDKFCGDKSRPDNLYGQCRECVAQNMHRYYLDNKQKVRERTSRWFAAHPTYRTERMRDYRKKDPQRYREATYRSRRKHKSAHDEGTKEWKRRHPGHSRFYQARRRSRTRNLP